MRSRLFLIALALFVLSAAALAQVQTSEDTPEDTGSRVFQLVLPSEHLLGDWGGLRSKLEESGITPRWFLITDVAGNATGGRDQGATQASSTELSLFFDLNRIAGVKGGSSLCPCRNAGAIGSRRSTSATSYLSNRSTV